MAFVRTPRLGKEYRHHLSYPTALPHCIAYGPCPAALAHSICPNLESRLAVQAHRTGKVRIKKIPVWTSLYQFPSRIPRPAGEINKVHQKTLKKQKKRQTYHILDTSETLYLCFANVLAQKMHKKPTKFDKKVKIWKKDQKNHTPNGS